MNTALSNTTTAVSSNPVTAKMIAEKLGMSDGTVRKCLGNSFTTCSSKTISLVRQTAQEMGYDPKKVHRAIIRKARETRYLLHSNFPSKEVETERMEILRDQGYSNSEIAKAIGKGYQAVIHRIGKQDESLTNQNRIEAQHIRKQKNLRRKMYAAERIIRQQEELIKRVDQIREQQQELAALESQASKQIESMSVEVAKAKKVLDQVDLAKAKPTALQ